MGQRSNGFAIETVEGCPVTKGSEGVMTFTADQIAMVAGAVRDKIEWMVLLHGTRSADGYEVKVDRFTIPPQYRSAGEVELAEDIALPADCVGVMHSHHSMGAFFSRTDDNELNPRFPSSIVVAIAANNLGFNYRACGKVVLPCGALGLVDFTLAIEGVERFAAEPIRGQHAELDVKNEKALQGCTRRYYAEHPDNTYLAVDQTQCGLTIGAVVEKPMVFGMNGSELLAAVQSMTRKPVDRRLPAHYTGGPIGFNRVRDDDRPAKKGGKGKKAKYSATRNGLVKLNRPEPVDKSKPYSVEGKCNECGYRDRIYFYTETQDWLCADCIKEIADAILEAAEDEQSSDDRTVIVTDQIDMDEVLENGGYGFGI